MGKSNFSDDFKQDAVAQITERGYPVKEVSRRLGEAVAIQLEQIAEVGQLKKQNGGAEFRIAATDAVRLNHWPTELPGCDP